MAISYREGRWKMKGYTLLFPLVMFLGFCTIVVFMAIWVGSLESEIERLSANADSHILSCDSNKGILEDKIRTSRIGIVVLGMLTGHDLRVLWEDVSTSPTVSLQP